MPHKNQHHNYHNKKVINFKYILFESGRLSNNNIFIHSYSYKHNIYTIKNVLISQKRHRTKKKHFMIQFPYFVHCFFRINHRTAWLLDKHTITYNTENKNETIHQQQYQQKQINNQPIKIQKKKIKCKGNQPEAQIFNKNDWR